MDNIWLFLVLQLLNVILSTIKSLLTIKGNKWSAVMANGIYFGYYTFIIKAIGDTETFTIFGYEVDGLISIAVITVITNFIGVYISLTLMERLRQDRLWLLRVSIRSEECQEFIRDLSKNELNFIVLNSSWVKFKPIDIYLYNKNESKLCKDIMRKYKSIKYCTIETDDKIKL